MNNDPRVVQKRILEFLSEAVPLVLFGFTLMLYGAAIIQGTWGDLAIVTLLSCGMWLSYWRWSKGTMRIIEQLKSEQGSRDDGQ